MDTHTYCRCLFRTFFICRQVINKHDVRAAVDILVENGGPRFKEQVETWGAVFEKKQR